MLYLYNPLVHETGLRPPASSKGHQKRKPPRNYHHPSKDVILRHRQAASQIKSWPH